MQSFKWMLILLGCTGFFGTVFADGEEGSQGSQRETRSGAPTPAGVMTQAASAPLAWDAMTKECSAKFNEQNVSFIFSLTNVSGTNLTISGTQTSCGCTVAQLPSQPWNMAPGESGQIHVTVNIAGKVGTLTKTVTVFTTAGSQVLTLKIEIAQAPPPMSQKERDVNVAVSMVDAMAIFKGNCADCHVTPTRGQMGGGLYMSACGICHESKNRASMVPNLHTLPYPTDVKFWQKIINEGKTNSLMPPFSVIKGGPLAENQVISLAQYLNKSISRNYNKPQTVSKPVTQSQTVSGVSPQPVPAQPTQPKVKRVFGLSEE